MLLHEPGFCGLVGATASSLGHDMSAVMVAAARS